jgi:hypothetical protein
VLTLNQVHLVTDPRLLCTPRPNNPTLVLLKFLGSKQFLKMQTIRKKLQSTPGTPPRPKGHSLDSLSHPNPNLNNVPRQPMKQLKIFSRHCWYP